VVSDHPRDQLQFVISLP